MYEVLLRWLIGLVIVSTLLGAILSYFWYRALAKLLRVKREITGWKAILTENGVLTGIIERAFFTVAIATNIGGVTIAMVAWTVLKSNTLWMAFIQKEKYEWNRVSVSLFASLGSMIIAIAAGKICFG